MAESVFKVIELVGTSTESWGKAASTSRISTPWSSHRSLTHSQERHAPTNRIPGLSRLLRNRCSCLV